jgi:anti-anti-sigma factor
MRIVKTEHGDEVELLLGGRVDGAMANELELEILKARKDNKSSILINLSEADFLCSAAIRALLQHHRQMKAQKKSLLISRASPEVDSILEVTGFRDLLVEKY